MLYSSFCQIVLSVVYIHLFDSYLIHTKDFDKNDHIVNIDCRVSFFIFTFLVGGVPWDFYQGKRGSKQLKTLVWRKQFTVSWTGHLDLRADEGWRWRRRRAKQMLGKPPQRWRRALYRGQRGASVHSSQRMMLPRCWPVFHTNSFK